LFHDFSHVRKFCLAFLLPITLDKVCGLCFLVQAVCKG
jgi:hypothetical protein